MSDFYLSEVPKLETPRMTLRAVCRDDIDAVFALHADEHSMRYWSFPRWINRSEAEAWFRDLQACARVRDLWVWVAVDTDSSEVLGLYALFAVVGQHRRCEISYLMAPAVWGRGYAREAAHAVIAFAFDAKGIERIEADIDQRNVASCRLAERLGFRREGVMRRRWTVSGVSLDTAFYGLLKEDFGLVRISTES
jgi:[ribosomal protein S5]-alanine N-acetyltransferase